MNKEKGATLYFVIIIMSILLAAVFSIGTVLLIQLRTIKSIGDSVIAYYAADSGAEVALDQGSSLPLPPPPSGSLGDAQYETEYLNAGDSDCLDAEYYCIRSKGTYRETERRVKLTR